MLEGTEQFSKRQPHRHRELPSSGERSALSGEVLMFLECEGTQEERLSKVTHHLCAFSNKKQRQPVRVGGRLRVSPALPHRRLRSGVTAF